MCATSTHQAGDKTSTHVVDDELIEAAIAECDRIVDEEVAGRSESWPSSAALSHWQLGQTFRRFLSLPHAP